MPEAPVGDDDPLAGLDGLPPGSPPTWSACRCPKAPSCCTRTSRPGTSTCSRRAISASRPSRAEGNTIRLRSVRPGVVVGEIALYTGVPRTADVVAETPSVVLRFSRDSIERMEAEEPEVAAALHRWLASTLAERLNETMKTFDRCSTRRRGSSVHDLPPCAGGRCAAAAEVRSLSEQHRSDRWPVVLAAGLIIGAVEAVLAVAFAALVYGGLLVRHLPDAIGLYLVAATLTLAILAWRSGSRGVVGTVQDAAAAVLAVVAATAAAKAAELEYVARISGLKLTDVPDVYLTVVAATMVVTILCGVLFLVLGVRRLGNLVRFVPYPVIGGFLAGTGWLLFRGGTDVASEVQVHLRTIGDLTRTYELTRWLPAFAFGLILLLAVRFVKRPPRDPGGDRGRAGGVRDRRARHGLLDRDRAQGRVAARAVRDDPAVAAVDVPRGRGRRLVGRGGVVGGNRRRGVRGRDLDPVQHQRERASSWTGTSTRTRSCATPGSLNVVSGALGGIPGYHALSLTALAARMNVDARAAGLARRARPARRGRVRRLGRRADPAVESSSGCSLTPAGPSWSSGCGTSAGPCRGSNTWSCSNLATIIARGSCPAS